MSIAIRRNVRRAGAALMAAVVAAALCLNAVSYTHLTLPTILLV